MNTVTHTLLLMALAPYLFGIFWRHENLRHHVVPRGQVQHLRQEK